MGMRLLALIPPPDNPPPRRLPHLPLPTYRFVPGLQQHPNLSDTHGMPHVSLVECWDYGWDLYEHHYWWEAHEVWERLWKAIPLNKKLDTPWPKEHPQRRYIQGHILLSADKLLTHLGRAKPSLRQKAYRFIAEGQVFDPTSV